MLGGRWRGGDADALVSHIGIRLRYRSLIPMVSPDTMEPGLALNHLGFLGEFVEARAGRGDAGFRHLLELAQAGRVAHLAEGLFFDLTDAFAGDLEVNPNLLERMLDAVPEAVAKD